MAYLDGFLVAVPVANKDAYRQSAADGAPIFTEFGVARFAETWGDEVPDGKVTDMRRAVKAEQDEAVVFSWFEYPDRETRDAAQQQMMTDPRMKALGETMPFDGKRMVYGGFEVIVDAGHPAKPAYIDGSVAPAAPQSRAAYTAYAARVAKAILDLGATRVVEAWSDDLQVGKVTDFRMSVNAAEDEAVVFSWIEWPSKAVRDAAWAELMKDPSFMPAENEMRAIDNQRRIFGGFEPILDV